MLTMRTFPDFINVTDETTSGSNSAINMLLRVRYHAISIQFYCQHPLSVHPYVIYNPPESNRYKKSVITKKLRIDKISCNEQKIEESIFSAYGDFF